MISFLLFVVLILSYIYISGTIEAIIVTLGLGITKALDITVGVPQRLISRILAVNGKIPTKLINISRSKIRDKTLLKSEVKGLNAAKTKNKEKKRFFDKITKSFERIVGRIGKILDNIKNVSTPRRLRNNGYFGKGDANSIRRLRGNSNSSRQQGRKEPKFSREEKTNDNNTKQQTREKNNTEKEEDRSKSNNGKQRENVQENNNLTNRTTTEDKRINNDNRQNINNKVQDYENQKQRQEIDNGRKSETTRNKNPSEQLRDSSTTRPWMNNLSLDALFRSRANEKKDSSDNWLHIAEVITNRDINGDNKIGGTPIENQKITDKPTEPKQPEKPDKPKNQEQERQKTTKQERPKAPDVEKPQEQSKTGGKSEEELMFEMFRKSTGANRNADQKEEIINNNVQQNNENVQKNVNNGKSVNNKSKSIF